MNTLITKTDKQVQRDVLAELNWEPSINAAKIGVEVNGGIVTLAGHVSSYSEKWDAEKAAQRVSGVKGLAVEMKVTLPGYNEREDVDIARSAQNVLSWASYLPSDTVKVMVQDGFVTLTGNVDWNYQRESAVDAVKPLMGVKGVNNQIAIKPLATLNLNTVKAGIEAALQRRATTDGHNIRVEVKGDHVELSGVVHSWSERELVKQTAWSTHGVQNIIDNMTVSF